MHGSTLSQLDALTAHRLETLTSFMAVSDLDALVLTMFDNVRWATNWRPPDFAEARDAGFAAIVTRDGACWFFSSYLEQRDVERDDAAPRDGLGQDAAGGMAPHVVESVPLPAIYPRPVMAEALGGALGRKLHELRTTSVGIDELSFPAHQQLAGCVPGCRLQAVALDLQVARAVKHPVEIDLMRAGAESLDQVTAVAMSALAAGETIDEARGRTGHEIYRHGAESISHMLIDVGEANGTGSTTARIDVGFYGREGYAADMARTTAVGPPGAGLREGFARIHDAYRRCLDELRPGRLASEFDRAARDVVAGLGQGDFWLVLGHGIGLRVCEHPNFTPTEMLVRDATLEPGMVISVELHLDHDGHPISLEDMLLLTETGAEPLTHAPHDFGAWS